MNRRIETLASPDPAMLLAVETPHGVPRERLVTTRPARRPVARPRATSISGRLALLLALAAFVLSCRSSRPPARETSPRPLAGSFAPASSGSPDDRDEDGGRSAPRREESIAYASAKAPVDPKAPVDAKTPADTKAPVDPDTVLELVRTDAEATSGPPYHLDRETIIRLVFERSARVTASREEMRAAGYGLEEFRSNLSRLEPYVETRANVSDFPNRRGAFGHNVETVVGVEKETFAGAVFRTEAGGSASRFDFDDRSSGRGAFIEEGQGVLVRSRVEAPFFGSRRRQNRVIAQAFQESNARRAQLDYLSDYRSYVDDALSYYSLTVYYERLAAAYQQSIDDLSQLLEDARLLENDRPRVESLRLSASTQRNGYLARQTEYRILLLATLNIGEDEEYEIEIAPYRESVFLGQASTPEEFEALLSKARENNPTFGVLSDAIRNTELQRQQAIDGRYDVTTFLEASLFPLGSASFDDRLDGWTVGGGVVLRLNDARVLTATRLRAEAEIRQFRAQMNAEEITMRRRIRTETQGLISNQANRRALLETLAQRRLVWEKRLEEYFEGKLNIDQLLDARSGLRSTETDVAENRYDSENRERRLLGATGAIYELVGLEIGVGERDTLAGVSRADD